MGFCLFWQLIPLEDAVGEQQIDGHQDYLAQHQGQHGLQIPREGELVAMLFGNAGGNDIRRGAVEAAIAAEGGAQGEGPDEGLQRQAERLLGHQRGDQLDHHRRHGYAVQDGRGQRRGPQYDDYGHREAVLHVHGENHVLRELGNADEQPEPLHALHHHEHGAEEEQRCPLDAVYQMLHILAIHHDQQQDHPEQRDPAEGQGAPTGHRLHQEADDDEDQDTGR